MHVGSKMTKLWHVFDAGKAIWNTEEKTGGEDNIKVDLTEIGSEDDE